MPSPEELAAAEKAKAEKEAADKAAAEKAKAGVKGAKDDSKSPQDPVKVKCASVAWPKPVPGQPPVEHGPLPSEVKFTWHGKRYVIPVGGVQKDTMPREAADFMLAKSARYWTLVADLSILEPKFS